MPFLWLCISIAFGAANTLFAKEATAIVGEVPEVPSEVAHWYLKFFSNPYQIAALSFWIPNLLGYTIAVSRLKLSYIFPLSQATQLVLIVVFSLLLFEEKVTWLGWLGIVIVCIGLFLISMRRNISDSKL